MEKWPAEVVSIRPICHNVLSSTVVEDNARGASEIMQTVSRFEANLLRLLYYFLRREPIERALPLVENRCLAPACLSKTTVRLVQDALAKGCTFELARRGG